MVCVFSVLLLTMCTIALGSRDCDSFIECATCTNRLSWSKKHCRWCPLDNACHSYGSILNSCRKEQNIVKSSMCYDTKNGTYASEVAYSNSLLSAAAYTDNPGQCLERIYPNSGFKIIQHFTQDCELLTFFEYKHCFAYIAISPSSKSIVLAYRGTDFSQGSQQLYDEMFSILSIPKNEFPTGGRVQEYFKQAHDHLYPGIRNAVKALVQQNPEYSVTVTGHSFGAALASQSSALLVHDKIVSTNTMTLYAFGMPRVGDKAYALQHDKLVANSWRVVHAKDIVSHLPTCNIFVGCAITADGPYHHGTEIYYPADEMYVNSTYVQCKRDEDMNCSNGVVEEDWCWPGEDLDTCISNHKIYFSVPIGTLCEGAK